PCRSSSLADLSYSIEAEAHPNHDDDAFPRALVCGAFFTLFWCFLQTTPTGFYCFRNLATFLATFCDGSTFCYCFLRHVVCEGAVYGVLARKESPTPPHLQYSTPLNPLTTYSRRKLRHI
ncbi:unnamed protein product, partial [Laminaria digitata]